MTDMKQPEATPQNLYQITDNITDVNSELHHLQAEKAAALRAQYARIAELEAENKSLRLLECYFGPTKAAAEVRRLSAENKSLRILVSGGVGESIKPPVQADTVIQVSVPTGWKLVPVEPTDDMFIEGMEADCRGRPSIDDDNHVRSIWRAMLSSAPDAPRPPAQSCCTCTKTADLHKAPAPAPAPAQQKPVAWIDVKPNPFDPSCRGAASVQDHALPPGEHKLYAAPKPDRQPLTDEAICEWWRSENGLEDCDMAKLTDFMRVIRAVEAAVNGSQQ